jgi:hypothetical protein
MLGGLELVGGWTAEDAGIDAELLALETRGEAGLVLGDVEVDGRTTVRALRELLEGRAVIAVTGGGVPANEIEVYLFESEIPGSYADMIVHAIEAPFPELVGAGG